MKQVFRPQQGPKVFISYSFGNQLADNLAATLCASGYQVEIVHDKMLLGTPSLESALTELIQKAEFVIPILDARANRSRWVETEFNIARRLKKIVIPIVQEVCGLSPLVAEIAYLNERSPTLSQENIVALRETIEAFYVFFSFEQQSPFLFVDETILKFMTVQSESRPMLRCIIDPYGTYEAAINALQRFESKRPPLPSERVASSGTTSSEDVAACLRLLNRLQELMCEYRTAMRATLSSYGEDLALRSLTSWQRLLRLVVGTAWLAVGRRFPKDLLPEILGDYGVAVSQASTEADSFSGDNSVCNNTSFTWAMQYQSRKPKGPHNLAPGKGGWFWCGFGTEFGKTFVGFFPATRRIADGVKHAQRPATYVENYEWADYGLPQLVARGVVFADRFGDSSYTSHLVYDLAHYHRSYHPS